MLRIHVRVYDKCINTNILRSSYSPIKYENNNPNTLEIILKENNKDEKCNFKYFGV